MEKEMYLFIMDDGVVFKNENFSKEDKESANDGYLTVIRKSDLKSYSEGKWIDINDSY